MADDDSSFMDGTTAGNAMAESEVENGIAGAPIVSNIREKSKGVSWDLELHTSNVADEPKVLCCIKVGDHVVYFGIELVAYWITQAIY